MYNYERGIEVVVGTYILDDDQRVLLFRSPKWDNRWTICGGHIEVGETIQDATNRELFEETGLKVKLIDTLPVSESFVHPPKFKRDAHFIFIDSVGKIDSDKPLEEIIKLDGTELTEYRWFATDEALALPDVVESCRKGLEKLQTYLKQKA